MCLAQVINNFAACPCLPLGFVEVIPPPTRIVGTRGPRPLQHHRGDATSRKEVRSARDLVSARRRSPDGPDNIVVGLRRHGFCLLHLRQRLVGEQVQYVLEHTTWRALIEVLLTSCVDVASERLLEDRVTLERAIVASSSERRVDEVDGRLQRAHAREKRPHANVRLEQHGLTEFWAVGDQLHQLRHNRVHESRSTEQGRRYILALCIYER